MAKIDLKKEYKEYYYPSKKEPVIVEVPEFQFLMIDGKDAREGSTDFQEAIQALFSVSYKTKFSIKKATGTDYAVMPLEGLWWADDMDDFINNNKQNWKWTLMIMQPDFVTNLNIEKAIEEVREKGDGSSLGKLRLENFTEGPSAQIMHIGPFSEEHANIMRIHELIENNGGTIYGQDKKHHEIYLSDFRRTAPENLRTVLRQGFVKE